MLSSEELKIQNTELYFNLKKACFELSKNIHSQSSSSLTEIEAYADELEFIALTQLENIISFNKDPKIIIQAIYYINQVYAIPPLRHHNIDWFCHILSILTELVVHHCCLEGEPLKFAYSLRENLTENLNEYNDIIITA